MLKATHPIYPILNQIRGEAVGPAKIDNLFANRCVLKMARSMLDPEAYLEWYRAAVRIQTAIYSLDHYYEQSEKLIRSSEAPLWKDVERQLTMGDSSNVLAWSAYDNLKRYALAEARIHARDTLDPREYETIVRLKCSDVQMARGLIWSYANRVIDARVINYWSLYDECWELIEDVDDLCEDGLDWNLNFWLYSFMAGHDPLVGICASARTLRNKLSLLEDAYRRLRLPDRDRLQTGYRATLSTGAQIIENQQLPMTNIASGRVVLFRDLVEHQLRVA